MTRESILMQYQSECLEALKSVANIRKPFEKIFMDAMKLFMAIPGRINFLQMGRYGRFSEQTYRNNFENGTFDWFSFNENLVGKHLTGSRKAIAVDPSYIPKSGKKTPWTGYFWSGCAGEYRRGLEIMGIGVIDVDNGFRVISRLRNDAVLFYPSTKGPTGKRGRPTKYDGDIDFSRLDTSRCTEHGVDKGKLYGLKAWSKALKRMVSLEVWYPDEGRTDKWQLYFSTDLAQSAPDVLEYYRARFQLEFCFRDSKQYAGFTNCQSTDFRKLAFHFNASLTTINLAKAACKRMGIPYSISSCKSMIHNAYMLERFICVFGIQPDTTLIDKIFKELILFTARAA